MNTADLERCHKMCKYCEKDGITNIDDNGEGIYVSIDSSTGDLIIDVTKLDDFMTTHIEYCPMCGRKLKE